MSLGELWQSCGAIIPELILVVTICVIVMADMLVGLKHSRGACGWLAIVGLLCALGWMVWSTAVPQPPQTVFGGMLIDDGLGRFFRFFFLLGTSLACLFSLHSRELDGYRLGEYYSLMLGATLGACLLAASNNFLMLVLGLETLSMCSYVLAGFVKHERASAEAGLKYTLYGAVASGIMLFGISYLYGLTGTIQIGPCMESIAHVTSKGMAHDAVVMTLILVLAGLGFKMAMVPFQFWCPDVYQGAPTPVTAFLSVVSKAAGFAALFRLTMPYFTPSLMEFEGAWLTGGGLKIFFGVLSVATMTFGNLVALRQTDVKRLLAYSSIAHAGYILMGMTVMSDVAMESMLAYFFIYLFMNLGAFWVVIVLINRLGGAQLRRFRGVALRAPLLFAALFVFLISLTGLPPTAGFAGKFLLFKVVVGEGIVTLGNGAIGPAWGYFALALVGMLNSVVSLFYYMKLAHTMVFEEAEGELEMNVNLTDHVLAVALAVPTVGLLYFAPVLQLIHLF